MDTLLKLADHGQSYWIDNLIRHRILSGELQRRVQREGLRGVISNPAIFHKALAGSALYDEQIEEVVAAGLPGLRRRAHGEVQGVSRHARAQTR